MGARSFVIVALPEEDHHVWKLSSEKKPHMTLLFLGDRLDNLDQATLFVQHAASMLEPFYMDVERRGVLGDKSADVLFFKSNQNEPIQQFRRNLLTHENIARAFFNAEQYPTWTPHLTMGYPETPANPAGAFDGKVYSVRFDRIALWTDDYEGAEFTLTHKQTELSMTAETGRNFLSHWGIKGMKWGVRRDIGPDGRVQKEKEKQAQETRRGALLAEKAKTADIRKTNNINFDKAKDTKTFDLQPSRDHKRASHVKLKAKVSGLPSLSNSQLQEAITRMNLEVQYTQLKSVSDNSFVGRGKRIVGGILRDATTDTLSSWLKRPGSNASGRSSAKARSWVGQQPVLDGNVVQRAIGS